MNNFNSFALIIIQGVHIILTFFVQRNIRNLEKKLDQDTKRIERIKHLVNGTSIASHNLVFSILYNPPALTDPAIIVPALTQIWGSIIEMNATATVIDNKELLNAVNRMEEITRAIPTSHKGKEQLEAWLTEFKEAATATYEASEKTLNEITKKQR